MNPTRSSLPFTLIVLLLSLHLGADGEDGDGLPTIPGVFACDGQLYIEATATDHNSLSMAMDPTGVWYIVTFNGQSIEYPMSEVQAVSYYGGIDGYDTVTMDADYSYQDAFMFLYGGHDTATISAHECELTVYGDYNAISAPAGGDAIVIGEGSPHNSYSGNVSDATVAPSNVYASSLPGVYDLYGTLTVACDPTKADTVVLATSGAGTKITINGASDTIPSPFTVATVVFTGSVQGGDQLTIGITGLTVKGVLFPADEQVSLDADLCELDVFGANDTFTATTGTTGGINLYYDGPNKPAETISANLVVNNTYQGGPMFGQLVPGSSTGSATAGGSGTSGAATGGTFTPAVGSGSSHGCGLGGGASAVLVAGLLLRRSRDRRRSALGR